MEDNVIDVSRDRETGEIQQFTIIAEDGQPELVKATAENILLHDPADDLPFEGGMYEFLQGDTAIVLSEDDPTVMVAPTSNEYCYVLRVGDNTVETTPEHSEKALNAIKDATINSNLEPIVSLFEQIMSSQVRREVVNALIGTFDSADRIERTPSGWLIDSFFLVDWTASMYAATDNPDEKDVRRSGSGVVETDSSYEFVQLSLNRDIEPVQIAINGDVYKLTEREMLFLGKVNWLLDRRHYHPDREFWLNVDQYADVDWRTGEPETDTTEIDDSSENDADLDNFSL